MNPHCFNGGLNPRKCFRVLQLLFGKVQQQCTRIASNQKRTALKLVLGNEL